jgi:hypothetical protein
MQSKAATVEEYLASLPEDRLAAIQTVRKVILKNLDKKYKEEMQYGMIGYNVPLSVYPKGYHCTPNTPLPFAALGNQKNGISLYIMPIYGDTTLREWFTTEWAKTGKKLDMGKSCIRFKKAEDLALDLIGQAIKKVPAKVYIANVEMAMADAAKAKAGAKKAKK